VNQPPLIRRSHCSPSAQASSLSSPDELICQSRTNCPVVSFSSTLDGDAQVPSPGTQGCRNGNPPKPHTHTQRQGHAFTLGSYWKWDHPLIERCSAAWQLYISLPPSTAGASYPECLASISISRVLSTVESSLTPFTFLQNIILQRGTLLVLEHTRPVP
jgi:hypothetical protein